ncbi:MULTISPECIES: methylthioribulose 1-phosphate dehydratase [unclassified Nodularia (in: cyanobacteria)]|uniref:methylthioribulose 1-phosphate dehydratase n=1 Tax=unclassified Nodularia (in: cyanobacteria) TaxID=2656917 RepID=UPI0018817CF5|nr:MULTISPECIES: methylthioribulose 1-phosphate dehydratase [unclassified Nodularia (in: cyanobacteria)]MBE9201716.1 methylthioribulose 1-phosphate dehydratase [Nodularia sp. LEGE 06071]MCC2691255.1 methylthioribulose 1-phosphate dehydratase [Nodularia sp. LEGE 04288]QOV09179.1 NocA [Nodularia sp. LEGE 06071]
MTSPTTADPRLQLIVTARYFYQQGWMLGTAGNLSARLPDGSFWITASGKSKGELLLSDFVRIAPDGKLEASASNLQPSAETSIHQLIYRLFPESQVCYHIHSIEGNLVSRLVAGDSLPLPPLEMLKGLGVWQENPCCVMPIFTNHLEVSQIAADIEKRFAVTPPQIPALLIRDHGITVWAASGEASRNYIELLEYIFRYMVVASRLDVLPNK